MRIVTIFVNIDALVASQILDGFVKSSRARRANPQGVIDAFYRYITGYCRKGANSKMIISHIKQHQRRILLIEPPFYRLYEAGYALVKFPLSLAYLSLAVKTHTEWDVKVFNADFAPVSARFDITWMTGNGYDRYMENLESPSFEIWSAVWSVLQSYRPTVVGISVKSSTLAAAFRIAGIAKSIDSSAVIVVGGPHPSSTGAEMLENRDIDICVSGEGETTLVELLHAIESGGSLDDVAGLSFRNGRQHQFTALRTLSASLDDLGFPFQYARDILIDYEKYPKRAFGYLFATRGCPHRCLYCGSREIWGRKPRFRDPEHVAMEITSLQSMGVTRFHFDDDTFGVTGDYLRRLCHALKYLTPGITWSCEIHVRLVNDANIRLMKDAGCRMIQLGIESGNDNILKHIRKGFTIEAALAACRLIVRHGIRLHTFFMAGFPWETEATLHDTRMAMETTDCEKIIYSLFTPYPGTEAFRLCRAEGLIPERYNPSLFGHQSPRNCFCLHLTPERFRTISHDLETLAAQKNRARRQV